MNTVPSITLSIFLPGSAAVHLILACPAILSVSRQKETFLSKLNFS